MSQDRKQRLLELDPETLADALIELADRDTTADEVVKKLIATPKEKHKQLKSKFAALKRSKRFIGWGESADFAYKLELLLSEIKESVEDPEEGVKLVAQFFEHDAYTLGRCDDSSGMVGQVFMIDACDLFIEYAQRCTDKRWLADLILQLNEDNNYGVRDSLFHRAGEFLTEPVIRELIGELQQRTDGASTSQEHDFKTRHWLLLIESLARQIKDPQLFEQTRRARGGKLNPAAYMDIGKVYLESGDAQTALSWVEKIPDDHMSQYDRDKLLKEIYGKLGEREKQESVAWQMFRRSPDKYSLEELLEVIGESKREEVIDGEIPRILDRNGYTLTDAQFLVEMNRIGDAAEYIVQRAGHLDGNQYYHLFDMAKTLESAGHYLATSAVYRALLDAILQKARSKAYNHAARYLRKLDELATSIKDWCGLPDHAAYMDQLKQVHGRKSAFWSKYNAQG